MAPPSEPRVPSQLAAAAPLEQWSQVSIVGLGLIGGSLARALRRQLPQLRIVGIERAGALPQLPAGLVDEALSEHDGARIDAAFASSELICVATPVGVIAGWLERALRERAVVTDCGSSKRSIAAAASAWPDRARFVPGHPMAGAGADRSALSAELFQGRTWLLCPEHADPVAVDAVERLVSRVGARPERIAAEAHDRAVAVTSHAPRLVASVLMALAEREQALAAAGPAFERITRGAGGSLEMWRDILGSNADEVARALRVLVQELEACAVELEQGGVEHNLSTLSAAERSREAFDAKRRRPAG
ncbi:MAG TPA: prephenate dehydrogenase/arogenate dehydrogenase family protein [Polyangiaceae bacterium]|jgi:prephenate dehydrogenase|nr:prephenate dehydrogenase/arogenate dehydrogenase family protein [Polyangiaceae bacterium]